MKLTDVKEEVNSQTIRWKSRSLRMSVSMPSLMKRINRRTDEEDRKRPVFMRLHEKSRQSIPTSLAELPSEHSDSSSESLSEKVEVGKLLPRMQEYGDIGITQRGSLPVSSNASRLEEEQFETRSKALLLIGNRQFSAGLRGDLGKLGLRNTDEARNLAEAMELYRVLARQHAIYLVIFADLSTPSLNGHAFVRNIRQNERITHIRRSFICGIGSELPLDLLDTASNPYPVPSFPCNFLQLQSILQQVRALSP